MNKCKTYEQYIIQNEIDTLVNEGIISAAMGAMIGPKVASAICKALGITKGPLYDMLNSSTFMRALSAYLSY